MPLTFRVTYADGTTEDQRLPVEAWFQSDRLVRTLASDREVREVRIDPDQMLPDVARGNNVWSQKD